MKQVRTDEPYSPEQDELAPPPLGGAVAAALALLIPLALMLGRAPGSPGATVLSSIACVIVPCVLAACAFVTQRERRMARVVKLGAYTLGDKIGEGGMGVVYRANHASKPREAAIKLLPKARASARNRARFELEVQRTRLLSHPNTISIFESGHTPEGGCYYAMEYIDGLDLQALVERDGPLSPGRVVHVLVQVLGALAEAHGMGLLHRDVKPANIMLCSQGDLIKVLDFGLVQDLGVAVPQSAVNELVGTPLYLSPEALTEPARLDERSDLYSVGAVGYFLLTGSPPFCGRNILDVCAQHLYGVPVPPSRRASAPVPPGLEALILQCLEKSPGKRPESAEVLRRALEPLVAECERVQAAGWALRERHCAVA